MGGKLGDRYYVYSSDDSMECLNVMSSWIKI